VSSNDSIKKTFIVAALLCLVCSVVVSTAAVLLKPTQTANKEKDFKINILRAGGIYDSGIADGKTVDEMFANISTKLVDLDTGLYTDAVDVDSFDQRKASKDPALSDSLSAADDLAKISRRVKYAKVYMVENHEGIEKLILPVKGYGLWSTLYGFIALESDLNTVSSFAFYEHAETPGLGGEVDNPGWKSIWSGKQVYQDGQVGLEVIKGNVNANSPNAAYQVDGLSGATLTSVGVSNLVKFWLGDMGFAPYINNLKNGDV